MKFTVGKQLRTPHTEMYEVLMDGNLLCAAYGSYPVAEMVCKVLNREWNSIRISINAAIGILKDAT